MGTGEGKVHGDGLRLRVLGHDLREVGPRRRLQPPVLDGPVDTALTMPPRARVDDEGYAEGGGKVVGREGHLQRPRRHHLAVAQEQDVGEPGRDLLDVVGDEDRRGSGPIQGEAPQP